MLRFQRMRVTIAQQTYLLWWRMQTQSTTLTFPEQEGDEHIRFGNMLTGQISGKTPYATMLNSYRETRENTINTSLLVTQRFWFYHTWIGNALSKLQELVAQWLPPLYPSLISMRWIWIPTIQRHKSMSLSVWEIQVQDYISQSAIVRMGIRPFSYKVHLIMIALLASMR